jgi:Putative peptidoglycan binding domain.
LEPSAYDKPAKEGRDADALKLLIMRVQAALYSKGYDPGAIDGTLTPETQSALRMFQLAHGIRATGTMTTPTLDALGVRL